MKLMNWGCGPVQPSGWINVDIVIPKSNGEGVEIDLLTEKSPWPDGSFDGIFANHSVCAISNNELAPILGVFYELLKPGGVLRVAVPDILAAFSAYQSGDSSWFPHMSQCSSIDEAFCTYFTWKSTNLSIFTSARLIELFVGSGFSSAWQVGVGQTQTKLPVITSLDNRPEETIIVEGLK